MVQINDCLEHVLRKKKVFADECDLISEAIKQNENAIHKIGWNPDDGIKAFANKSGRVNKLLSEIEQLRERYTVADSKRKVLDEIIMITKCKEV